MSELVPVTDELLDRARGDEKLRHRLLAEHLDRLMIAMGKARKTAKTDAVTTRSLEEGARLAIKLTEILNAITRKSGR